MFTCLLFSLLPILQSQIELFFFIHVSFFYLLDGLVGYDEAEDGYCFP
jgi:hypothetical protein